MVANIVHKISKHKCFSSNKIIFILFFHKFTIVQEQCYYFYKNKINIKISNIINIKDPTTNTTNNIKLDPNWHSFVLKLDSITNCQYSIQLPKCVQNAQKLLWSRFMWVTSDNSRKKKQNTA